MKSLKYHQKYLLYTKDYVECKLYTILNYSFGFIKKLIYRDLSNNKISKIAPDAFQGLKALTSL